jgi:hypothetical protein
MHGGEQGNRVILTQSSPGRRNIRENGGAVVVEPIRSPMDLHDICASHPRFNTPIQNMLPSS